MQTPQAPQAPDPKETAAAQGQMNKETAIAQANLNAVNQVTPQGTLTWETIGTNPDGTPIRRQTQAYSPEQQRLYDQQTALSGQLNQLATDQTGRLSGLLGKPVDLSNEATEGRLMELGRARLDPLMQQRRSSMETRLANQGVMPGSAAYDRAMQSLGQQENDAYNSLLLSGRQQSASEALQERNQPINEITALMSGGQVSGPTWNNTGQTGINPADYQGAVRDKYNSQMQQYNAEMQSSNAMMGGLFGLASAGLGGWMRSDVRVKTSIKRVGTADNGLPIYLFRYKDGGPMQMGFMAQDVEKVHPEAVAEFHGVKHILLEEAAR